MVDPASASYYERTHHGSFWRQRGDQPLLIRARIRKIRRLAAGLRLLDVGLGEGHFLRRVRESGYTAIGADISWDGVQRARAVASASQVVQANATCLPFASNAFDVLTLWDVIEHVGDTDLLLAEARRVLRTGGLLALSTPNPQALSVRCRGRGSVQFTDSTHINIQTRPHWEQALLSSGFAIVASGGDAWWDPPYSGGPLVSLFAKITAQCMFAISPVWPVSTAENSVIFARSE